MCVCVSVSVFVCSYILGSLRGEQLWSMPCMMSTWIQPIDQLCCSVYWHVLVTFSKKIQKVIFSLQLVQWRSKKYNVCVSQLTWSERKMETDPVFQLCCVNVLKHQTTYIWSIALLNKWLCISYMYYMFTSKPLMNHWLLGLWPESNVLCLDWITLWGESNVSYCTNPGL